MTERVVFSFALSAAILSVVTFLLCAIGWARPATLISAAIAVTGAGTYYATRERSPKRPLGRFWMILFAVAAVPFAILYIVNAAAPEISPDGAGYHLGLVRRYLNHGGFYRLTTHMYANLSQGCEMLFLVAYSIGRHSAAALTHCLFLLALPVAMISYARRFLTPRVGVLAALMVFVSPVAGIDGTSAYVDVALAFASFATFYLLEAWDDEGRRDRMLAAAGLLAGFAFAIKYTGAVMMLYAIAFAVWRLRAARRPWLRPLAILCGAAALVAAPWLVKNWILVANPLSPFFNSAFPNPYIHIDFEQQYRQAMAHFGGYNIGWSTPFEVTVRGAFLQGTIGPVFLLAPAGLLAIRNPRGRRILAVGILCLLPWFANIGTRFLIPCLPFAALAIAIALERWTAVLTALVVVNVIACWPWVLEQYCAPYDWRLSRFPVQAALRIMPEDQFLDTYAPEVRFARLIQKNVPPNGVVYTALPILEAYTDRTIILNYESALGIRIEETLATAVGPERQPSTRVRFHFAPESVRKVRVVLTGDAPSWRIHEVEIPGAAKAQADPNPWEAKLGADGNLATFWDTWQRARPEMHLDVELAATTRLEQVDVRMNQQPAASLLRLDGQLPSGEWRTLERTPEITRGVDIPDLRAAAIAEMRRCGVTHLLIHKDERMAPDYREHTSDWEIRQVAEDDPIRLYEIQPSRTKGIDLASKTRNNTR